MQPSPLGFRRQHRGGSLGQQRGGSGQEGLAEGHKVVCVARTSRCHSKLNCGRGSRTEVCQEAELLGSWARLRVLVEERPEAKKAPQNGYSQLDSLPSVSTAQMAEQ